MSEALQLILVEMQNVREDVKEARDAAMGAAEGVKSLEGTIGGLLGDVATCRKKSEEALTRVQAVEVRLDERRFEKAQKWAFAGSAIIAICGLIAIIYQVAHASKAEAKPEQPSHVQPISDAKTRPGTADIRPGLAAQR